MHAYDKCIQRSKFSVIFIVAKSNSPLIYNILMGFYIPVRTLQPISVSLMVYANNVYTVRNNYIFLSSSLCVCVCLFL